MKDVKLKGFKIKSIRAERILALIFFVIILLEGYLLYSRVYQTLNAEADLVSGGNVVRVDLNAYNQTLDLLDRLKIFVVEPWNLPDENPFQ
jgi:hypothetical protein